MIPSPLHFSFIPAGGIETASSRIRVYTLYNALVQQGFQGKIGYSLKANVLFFQKKVTLKNLLQARLARARGCVIMYDVDDFGKSLCYWVSQKHFRAMLSVADIVTVCSAGQLDLLTSEYKIRGKAAAIPNAIDYFPPAPVRLAQQKREKLRIVWFGNGDNFYLFERYLKALRTIQHSEIVAIVNEAVIPEVSRMYSFVHFLPWRMNDFVSNLQSCDLACLMHDGTVYDTAKGNNRMISSITWGVPAVVSRTPEYERTAKESGIEYAVFSNEEELYAVIERLRSPVSREQYLEAAQSSIWSRYAADIIAKQYLDLVDRFISGRRDRLSRK